MSNTFPRLGAVNATDLLDFPNDYTGNGLLYLRVKATEDGIEFAAVSGPDGDGMFDAANDGGTWAVTTLDLGGNTTINQGGSNITFDCTAQAWTIDKDSTLFVGAIYGVSDATASSPFLIGHTITMTGAGNTTRQGMNVTITGASTTSTGLHLDVSGSTNNYALITEAGQIGLGTTSPDSDAFTHIVSTTSSSLNYSIVVENSSGADVLRLRDDNHVLMGGSSLPTTSIGLYVTSGWIVARDPNGDDSNYVRMSHGTGAQGGIIEFEASSATTRNADIRSIGGDLRFRTDDGNNFQIEHGPSNQSAFIITPNIDEPILAIQQPQNASGGTPLRNSGLLRFEAHIWDGVSIAVSTTTTIQYMAKTSGSNRDAYLDVGRGFAVMEFNNNSQLGLYVGSSTPNMGTSGDTVVVIEDGTAPAGLANHSQLYVTSGELHVVNANGDDIVIAQQSALTTALTTITFTAPGTPDYAFQDVTSVMPVGFADAEELRTFISVVANNQARINELETKLQSLGLLA